MPTTIVTRATPISPDRDTLTTAVQTAAGDPTARVASTPINSGREWEVTTAAPLTDVQRTVVQSAIDTAVSDTSQHVAQLTIDRWPIELQALVLALIDQLNIIRAALVPPKLAITPAQALAAVRAKAGTL